MKNIKGISCKVNQYHVTAIAVRNGQPVSITFDATQRNGRDAKKFAASELGVKASQVLVNFELEKKSFIIDADYDTLMNALSASDIHVTFADDTEPTE